jgi:hypothetical protein
MKRTVERKDNTSLAAARLGLLYEAALLLSKHDQTSLTNRYSIGTRNNWDREEGSPSFQSFVGDAKSPRAD